MRVLSALLLAVSIGGCASQMQMAWIRIDGVRGDGDPARSRQFELDKTACLGVQPGGTAGAAATVDASETARACMADRGYVLVRENEVDAKAAELRAAAEKKRRDEAPPAPASAPPPKRR